MDPPTTHSPRRASAPPIEVLPDFDESLMDNSGYLSEPQIGGGDSPAGTPKRRRRQQTPPQITPTRLRNVIHRSDRDAGSIISNAQDRRAKLLQETQREDQPDDRHSPTPLPPAPGPSDPFGCEVSLPVPTTRVIPPTPNASRASASTSKAPPGASESPIRASRDSVAPGRLSDHDRAVLASGFDNMEAVIQKIVKDTGLTSQQVLTLWDKKNGRETKLGNSWNIYEGYLKDPANQADEIRRAGLTYPCQITHEVRSQCFAKFKTAYPDSWTTILETWQDVQMYEAPGQTLAQRGRVFHKFVTQIVERANFHSARHGFEMAAVFAGKAVNQDASLGKVFSTEGAKDFFLSRCRADDNVILGHFKAHIYDKLSLTVVSDTFDEHTQEDSSEVPENCKGGDEEAPSIPSNSIQLVKDKFTEQLTKCGSSWPKKTFPWQKMPTILAENGIICENYPDSVPFPGEKPAKAQKSKGVNDLSKLDVSCILEAFEDPHLPLTFKKVPADKRAGLMTSKAPVIIGVPPDPSSTHLFGRRKFANGNVDNHGPPRLAVSPAKTSIKGKGKKTERPVPLDLPEKISSLSPVPEPRRTRLGAQKRSVEVRIQRLPHQEDVEVVSDGEDEQPPIRHHASKKRVKFSDSDSGDDSPIVKRRTSECPTSKKRVKSAEYVAGSGSEEEEPSSKNAIDYPTAHSSPHIRPKPTATRARTAADIGRELFPEEDVPDSLADVDPRASPTGLQSSTASGGSPIMANLPEAQPEDPAQRCSPTTANLLGVPPAGKPEDPEQRPPSQNPESPPHKSPAIQPPSAISAPPSDRCTLHDPTQASRHIGDRYGFVEPGGMYPPPQDGYAYHGHYPLPPLGYGYFEHPQGVHPSHAAPKNPQWYRRDTSTSSDRSMAPLGDYRALGDHRSPDYRDHSPMSPTDHQGASLDHRSAPPPKHHAPPSGDHRASPAIDYRIPHGVDHAPPLGDPRNPFRRPSPGHLPPGNHGGTSSRDPRGPPPPHVDYRVPYGSYHGWHGWNDFDYGGPAGYHPNGPQPMAYPDYREHHPPQHLLAPSGRDLLPPQHPSNAIPDPPPPRASPITPHEDQRDASRSS